jgi:large subunit ribosomal protein L6
MSRVGSAPIQIPQGVECQLTQGVLKAKGKLGELVLSLPSGVEVNIVDGNLKVALLGKSKQARMLWGTIRARAYNMVKGVSEGFTRNLEINGVGYRAALQDTELVLSLGHSHEIRYPIPAGITVKCDKPTEVSISGIDKQAVGQVASEIRAFRSPEPYKGKGVKYAGEKILRKEGKKK